MLKLGFNSHRTATAYRYTHAHILQPWTQHTCAYAKQASTCVIYTQILVKKPTNAIQCLCTVQQPEQSVETHLASTPAERTNNIAVHKGRIWKCMYPLVSAVVEYSLQAPLLPSTFDETNWPYYCLFCKSKCCVLITTLLRYPSGVEIKPYILRAFHSSWTAQSLRLLT